MKTIAIGAMLATLAGAATFAQGTTGNGTAQKLDAKHNHVCLWAYLIDHTTTVDPSTILFHMRGGKIWKNTLRQPCPGLKFHGFAFVSEDQYVCSNMQAISVITTHQSCKLGAFEPYTLPAPKQPQGSY